jgi:DNA-binding response OmpR family regulator
MIAPKPRVLLVENDFTVAQNLYAYLELKGFAPDAAYDGHGALGLLETGEFDAVILDIGLPGKESETVVDFSIGPMEHDT